MTDRPESTIAVSEENKTQLRSKPAGLAYSEMLKNKASGLQNQ